MADRKHLAKPDKRRMSEEGGKKMIWVYPSNNWISNFNRTFVYGWCNPKAKLFVAIMRKHRGLPVQPIQIFSNGNFAQTIKLPNKKNVVNLIQILNGKKKTISRNIVIKKLNNVIPNLIGNSGTTVLDSRESGNDNSKNTVVAIDPGHGGKEHGTHSPKGIPEKVFNLQIAKLLYRKMRGLGDRGKGGVKVYLTRTKDKFVSLKKRVNFAKKKKCNIFISIHHNALPDNENPLKHIGVGIYYTHDFVKPFAKKLLATISKESGLKKYGIFKRDFAVTRPNSYNGVLIECGFLIHPEESEYITKRKVQERIVAGIVKGFT